MLIDIEDLKKQLASAAPGAAAKAEKEAAALAEQGNLDAAAMLVELYADGAAAVRADRIKEFKYTRIAAELGSGFHRCWLARLQRASNDHAGALANARLAHDMGEPAATTLLAQMMLAGEGEPARPLEALQLLSDSVEDGTHTQAALMLAEVQLEGKFIPANPQGAYDLLHRYDAMFAILRHPLPAAHSRYLYLKAEAIRAGARPVGDDTWAGLVGAAADAGSSEALALRGAMRSEAEHHQRNAEWDALSRFRACAGDWKMFTKIAVLRDTASKSHTSVSGFNGNVSSTTSYWQIATFEMAAGHQFTVSLPSKASLVNGRSYAVVFVGPENDDSGVPMTVFDLHSGAACKTNSDFISSYRQNGAKWRWNLAYVLMVFFAAPMALGLFTVATVLGLLGVAAVGAVWWKLRKAQAGGYQGALEKAGVFFGKHRSSLA